MKYIDIVMASVYPAILYMTGITLAVIVYALSKNLPRLKEVVDSAVIYRTLPAFVVSFIAVCALLINSYSPSYAGFVGCCIALLMCLFQGADKPKLFELRQAFLEGFVLFFVLLFFRKKERFKIAGILSSFFLIFYSIFRFIIEYFKVPDEQLGYLILNATMGQIISFVFFVAGIFLFFSKINVQKKT